MKDGKWKRLKIPVRSFESFLESLIAKDEGPAGTGPFEGGKGNR
jgi:hypothetical protein